MSGSDMGEAAYSFATEVDWNNGLHLQAPGVLKPWSLMATDEMPWASKQT